MDLRTLATRTKLYTKLYKYWSDDKNARENGNYYPIDQQHSIYFMCEYIFDADIGVRNYDSYTGYAWTKILNPVKDI